MSNCADFPPIFTPLFLSLFLSLSLSLFRCAFVGWTFYWNERALLLLLGHGISLFFLLPFLLKHEKHDHISPFELNALLFRFCETRLTPCAISIVCGFWVSWDLLPIFPSIHRQSVGAHGWSWNWFAKGKIVLLGAFLFRAEIVLIKLKWSLYCGLSLFGRCALFFPLMPGQFGRHSSPSFRCKIRRKLG